MAQDAQPRLRVVDAEARPSASVILVRDAPDGLETFMVRRHARSPVAPSAYVFPGGTVRDDDLRVAIDDGEALARALSDRSDHPVDAAHATAFYVCAIRELFEEAGVILVRDTNGQLLTVDESDTALQERLESTRLTLQAHELSIGGVLQEYGWRLAFDLLVPFSHWITPRALAARFDTRFFVAVLPPGQSALHDTIETSEGVWLPPNDVLDGDYHTVYATAQHLRRLGPLRSVQELLDFARTKSIRMVSPEVVEGGEGLRVFIRPDIADSW
jgi:8-oxo-dGTP pyrophosphatase MutT (NUDIX family)